MNRVRLIVAAGILASLVWLSWRIIPTMGMFRMALYDPPLPENGYSLVFIQEGKIIDSTALAMLKTDWSIIWQVWPLLIFGLLFGITIGYPFGEFVRRKYAIDRASEIAIHFSEELRKETIARELNAENTLKKAQALEAKTKSMQAELLTQRQEILSMKEHAETQMEAVEGWRQRIVSLQKDLTKARAKIRRMEKKTSGRRGKKPIDELGCS